MHTKPARKRKSFFVISEKEAHEIQSFVQEAAVVVGAFCQELQRNCERKDKIVSSDTENREF